MRRPPGHAVERRAARAAHEEDNRVGRRVVAGAFENDNGEAKGALGRVVAVFVDGDVTARDVAVLGTHLEAAVSRLESGNRSIGRGRPNRPAPSSNEERKEDEGGRKSKQHAQAPTREAHGGSPQDGKRGRVRGAQTRPVSRIHRGRRADPYSLPDLERRSGFS